MQMKYYLSSLATATATALLRFVSFVRCFFCRFVVFETRCAPTAFDVVFGSSGCLVPMLPKVLCSQRRQLAVLFIVAEAGENMFFESWHELTVQRPSSVAHTKRPTIVGETSVFIVVPQPLFLRAANGNSPRPRQKMMTASRCKARPSFGTIPSTRVCPVRLNLNACKSRRFETRTFSSVGGRAPGTFLGQNACTTTPPHDV